MEAGFARQGDRAQARGQSLELVKAPFNTNGCPRLYRRRQLCEHDRHAHDLLVTI
jgi:hypothetical protein